MANPSYSTGTVSINDGDTVFVGTGTIWSGVNAKPGDTIYIGDQPGVEIKDVTDTTHGTLWAPWAGGAQSGVAYTIVQNYPARVVGVAAAQDVGTMIAKLKTGGLPFLVEAPETEPDPSLGADGQYAIEPISGEQWLKTGGLWVSQGIFRAFGVAAPWSGATDYVVNDVATDSGTSYICILAHTNHEPPNATYWTVLAAKGATGPAAWSAPAAWLTATAYVAGPPASVVVQGGETYTCLVAHTSGTFATDLGAGKWLKVAQKGTDGTNGSNGANGAGYGGTSTTSLAIATGSKVFTTQAGLAYPASGGYVRASSAANGANYMEGLATYSGTTLTIAVTAIGGSGTKADWNFSVAGSPGGGSGTVTQVVAGAGLSGGTITTSGTIALALNNVTLQASVASPTATSSTSQVMMGLGSTFHLTPVYSTRIHLTISGYISALSAGLCTVTACYGTGAAPSNGAAATGTVIGSALVSLINATLNDVPFSKTVIITGLTPGTAYWFDMKMSNANGSSTSMVNVDCAAFEF